MGDPGGKELRAKASALHPVPCEQPNPANHHWLHWEADPCPDAPAGGSVDPGLTAQQHPGERVWRQVPSEAVPEYLTHRHGEMINVGHFKLLRFGVIRPS